MRKSSGLLTFVFLGQLNPLKTPTNKRPPKAEPTSKALVPQIWSENHACLTSTITCKRHRPMPPFATVPTYVSLPRTLKLMADPLRMFTHYNRQYGHNYHIFVGGTRKSLMTTDPVTVQHVLQKNHRNYYKSEIQSDQLALYLGKGLLTNNGESWLRQRRLIQPGFHRERLANLVDLMQEVIRKESDEVARRVRQGEEIDIYEVMLQTAFRIVARALFSEDISDEQLHDLSEKITKVQEFIIYPIRLPFIRPALRTLGIQQRYQRIAQSAFSILRNLIEKRKAQGQVRDDLLQMLLDARYEDNGEPMDAEQLLEEVVILFVAGHETTANAMAWTFYLLAKHPNALAQLNAALEGLSEQEDLGAQLRQMPYVQQVIEESMRLYPPAWITDRFSLAPDEIQGQAIPAKTLVGIFIYGIHHHPDYWPDPENFQPERFSAAAKKERPTYAYLPFGGGPRLCIGNNFALLEMQLILAEFVQRFDFQLVAGQEIVGKPLVTLRPKYGIRLKMSEKP